MYRSACRIYLALYAVILFLAFNAQGTLTPAEFKSSAVMSAIVFPPAFLPFVIWRMAFRPKRRFKDHLDRPLHTWPSGDHFTIRDMLRSLCVIGSIGSGKSSASMLMIARMILSLPRSSAVVFCSKPEDLDWWKARIDEAGRSDDLIVFSEKTKAACNLVDFLRAQGLDAKGITEFLMVSSEVLDSVKAGKAPDPFWPMSMNRLLWSAIAALIQGTDRLTVADIQHFISTAAYSKEQKADPEWKKGFHFRVLQSAAANVKTPIAEADFNLFSDFWLNEFPLMDGKTRSSIMAGVNNILHVYNQGLISTIASGETNTTPDDLFKGKIWVLNFPVPDYGATGKFLMSAFKYVIQKAILQRVLEPGGSIVGVIADEAPNVINSYDAQFMNESRSHGAFTCYAAQSIHSFHNAMDGEHKTMGMMTAFGTLFAHVVNDVQTATFLSSLLGQRREAFVTPSGGGKQDPWDRLTGMSRMSFSVSEQYQPVLQPNAFMSGLRTGGEANGFKVDVIVIRSGQPFLNGERYQYVAFDQR